MKMLRLGAIALAFALFSSACDAQPTGRTTSNQSATIATGNTFQTILAAGNRQSLTIQNNNATNSCWIYLGADTATKARSILLLAGGSYTRYWPFIPIDAIQATCASNGDTIYLDIQ